MTRYIGTSGEYFVASHLLRLRLNTTPLPVDDGLDLIGHRTMPDGESRTYLFQVKTTQNREARIRFRREQFDRLLDQAVNLVVVLWATADAPRALVVPPRLLRMLTTGGFEDPRAPIPRDESIVRIRVEDHEGRIYVRNRLHDFTGMTNRFDLCEATDVDTTAHPEYAVWPEPPAVVRLDPDPPEPRNVNTLGGEPA